MTVAAGKMRRSSLRKMPGRNLAKGAIFQAYSGPSVLTGGAGSGPPNDPPVHAGGFSWWQTAAKKSAKVSARGERWRDFAYSERLTIYLGSRRHLSRIQA
jgi:hypothetical protein